MITLENYIKESRGMLFWVDAMGTLNINPSLEGMDPSMSRSTETYYGHKGLVSAVWDKDHVEIEPADAMDINDFKLNCISYIDWAASKQKSDVLLVSIAGFPQLPAVKIPRKGTNFGSKEEVRKIYETYILPAITDHPGVALIDLKKEKVLAGDSKVRFN